MKSATLEKKIFVDEKPMTSQNKWYVLLTDNCSHIKQKWFDNKQ